jgi:hypothetical protein
VAKQRRDELKAEDDVYAEQLQDIRKREKEQVDLIKQAKEELVCRSAFSILF